MIEPDPPHRIGLLLLLALIGCSPGRITDQAPPRKGEIHIETFPPPRIVQGEPGSYRIRIENHTGGPILLLKVQPAASRFPLDRNRDDGSERIQEGALHRWTHRLPGRTQFLPDRNQFLLHPGASSITYVPEQMLYSGLVLNEEERTVKLRTVYQEPGRVDQEFVLRYIRTTRRELLKRTYLPEKRLSAHPDADIAFSKSPDRTAESLAEASYLLVSPEFDMIRERLFSRSVKVHPRTFSKDRALSTLETHLDRRISYETLHFAPWRKSWVIRTGDKSIWAVTPSTVTRLTGLTMNHVRILSSGSGRVPFYLDRDLRSDPARLRRIADGVNKEVSRLKSGSWKASRRDAASAIAALREEKFVVHWIREPMTNRSAVYVYDRK